MGFVTMKTTMFANSVNKNNSLLWQLINSSCTLKPPLSWQYGTRGCPLLVTENHELSVNIFRALSVIFRYTAGSSVYTASLQCYMHKAQCTMEKTQYLYKFMHR